MSNRFEAFPLDALLDLSHEHHTAAKAAIERHAALLAAVGYRMALGESLKAIELIYTQTLQCRDSLGLKMVRDKTKAEARRLCAGCVMNDGTPMAPPEWASDDAEE